MATPRFISGTNGGYLPVATGQVIGYVRDASEFAVNRWIQRIEAPAPTFTYHVLDFDQPVRVINEALFAWESGSPRPTGHTNLTSFQMLPGRCFRRDYPFTLGLQNVEIARKMGAFDPEAVESKSVASQAMTIKTNRLVQMCETVANWPTTNTADANVMNGGAGKWSEGSDDESSPNYLAIQKSILAALVRINLLTNARVKPKDLRLVISPELAQIMANTSEIRDFNKQQSGSANIQKDTLGDVNKSWGLPERIHGVELVVEDAPIVTIPPNADGTQSSIALGTRAFIKSRTSAMLISQSGGIDAPYGAPSFATVQCYYFKHEMEVQSRTDTWNDLIEGHVVEQYKEVLAAGQSGFLFTNVS